MAYEIPSRVLDRIGLFFCDESPHKVGNGPRCVQLEVQGDIIFGDIQQVDEAPGDLVNELEEVMARSEREDGVQ